MIVNKDEYFNNIENEIMSLGINEQFRKNPAFNKNSILGEFTSIIRQAPEQNIKIEKEENKIEIDYNTLNGRTSAKIVKLSSNPNTFYIQTRVDENINSNLDQIKYNLTKVELDEKTGQIKTENKCATFTIINGIDTEITVSNKQNFFNSHGIEHERIYKLYDNMIFDKSVTDMLTSSYDMAFSHMNGFMSPSDNQLVYASSVRRNGIDTARVQVAEKEDSMMKVKYDTELRLSNEHGLQEMRINGGVFGLTTYIPKLTNQELEETINNENDSTVREGLRNWNNEIVDRTKVDYDPELDKNLTIKNKESILKAK